MAFAGRTILNLAIEVHNARNTCGNSQAKSAEERTDIHATQNLLHDPVVTYELILGHSLINGKVH